MWPFQLKREFQDTRCLCRLDEQRKATVQWLHIHNHLNRMGVSLQYGTSNNLRNKRGNV